MTMIGLDGISFETADVRDINALHRDLNTLLRNIGDERSEKFAGDSIIAAEIRSLNSSAA